MSSRVTVLASFCESVKRGTESRVRPFTPKNPLPEWIGRPISTLTKEQKQDAKILS